GRMGSAWPLVTHMPSGLTDLTKAIYTTTEEQKINEGVRDALSRGIRGAAGRGSRPARWRVGEGPHMSGAESITDTLNDPRLGAAG
ncbi:MAG TPA: hypothetical protein VG276_01190, partial [Actinomycetes bacterium]|nr:hypothetical protein [Actinomycetes bacterium]